MLPDHEIMKRVLSNEIGITPFNQDHVQPASVDLTLANHFLELPRSDTQWFTAATQSSDAIPVILDAWYGGLMLYPLRFALGSTVERIRLPATIAARVEGRSSLGRSGLMVHITAGFIDPGYDGTITLEFFNASPRPILLRPGIRICQISFFEMASPAKHPYGHPDLHSKYQGSFGVEGAKSDAER